MKRSSTAVAIVSFGVWVSACAPAAFHRAEESFERRDYLRALKFVDTAIAKKPEYEPSYLLKGRIAAAAFEGLSDDLLLNYLEGYSRRFPQDMSEEGRGLSGRLIERLHGRLRTRLRDAMSRPRNRWDIEAARQFHAAVRGTTEASQILETIHRSKSEGLTLLNRQLAMGAESNVRTGANAEAVRALSKRLEEMRPLFADALWDQNETGQRAWCSTWLAVQWRRNRLDAGLFGDRQDDAARASDGLESLLAAARAEPGCRRTGVPGRLAALRGAFQKGVTAWAEWQKPSLCQTPTQTFLAAIGSDAIAANSRWSIQHGVAYQDALTSCLPGPFPDDSAIRRRRVMVQRWLLQARNERIGAALRGDACNYAPVDELLRTTALHGGGRFTALGALQVARATTRCLDGRPDLSSPAIGRAVALVRTAQVELRECPQCPSRDGWLAVARQLGRTASIEMSSVDPRRDREVAFELGDAWRAAFAGVAELATVRGALTRREKREKKRIYARRFKTFENTDHNDIHAVAGLVKECRRTEPRYRPHQCSEAGEWWSRLVVAHATAKCLKQAGAEAMCDEIVGQALGSQSRGSGACAGLKTLLETGSEQRAAVVGFANAYVERHPRLRNIVDFINTGALVAFVDSHPGLKRFRRGAEWLENVVEIVRGESLPNCLKREPGRIHHSLGMLR